MVVLLMAAGMETMQKGLAGTGVYSSRVCDCCMCSLCHGQGAFG